MQTCWNFNSQTSHGESIFRLVILHQPETWRERKRPRVLSTCEIFWENWKYLRSWTLLFSFFLQLGRALKSFFTYFPTNWLLRLSTIFMKHIPNLHCRCILPPSMDTEENWNLCRGKVLKFSQQRIYNESNCSLESFCYVNLRFLLRVKSFKRDIIRQTFCSFLPKHNN